LLNFTNNNIHHSAQKVNAKIYSFTFFEQTAQNSSCFFVHNVVKNCPNLNILQNGNLSVFWIKCTEELLFTAGFASKNALNYSNLHNWHFAEPHFQNTFTPILTDYHKFVNRYSKFFLKLLINFY